MKALLLLLTIFTSLSFLSQNWVNSGGGNSNDESYDVEVDNSGNIYTVGYVTGAVVFGNNVNVTTNGNSDIYVSKSDPNGNFLWAKVFGGNLPDRGYDLAIDAQGNIIITGYFIGTALFDNITLTSVNNSQDIFLAKLDNNGNVLWAISEGGSDAEIGYGVSVDDGGSIIITGQFKGTSTIAGNTFISATDPITGLQGFDFFVAKYDGNGNALWSLNGVAKYDDRGVAVATDNNNNIIITGQFSDTLQFAGTTINNTIYNAGMVFQLDPNGNLNWFKRIGAFQTMAYDVAVDADNNLYVTGDFQGQMVIFDSPNFFLNGNYTYRYFVLKIDATGHVIWGQSVGSESRLSSKAISLDNNNDVYVAGTFRCVLDDYADSLGSAYFNSVGYNDIFITKFLNNGTRDWVYQAGGPREDYCSGIAVHQIDNPVISGSYDRYFNFPINNSFSNSLSGNSLINSSTPLMNGYLPQASNSCTGNYKYLKAHKSKDMFVGCLFNNQLGLYNYYNNENSTCGNLQEPCFRVVGDTVCKDSIINCGAKNIYFWPKTFGNGLSPDQKYYFPLHPYHQNSGYNSYSHHIGPYWNFNYSVPNGNVDFVTISNTDDYYFNGGTIDGCKSYFDTVFVQINPFPTLPQLTDDKGFNFNQPSEYNTIHICMPDSVLLSFSAWDSTEIFTFRFPNGTIYVDTNNFYISQEGLYLLEIENEFGCIKNAELELIHDIIIKDTLVPYIMLYDIVDFNDSITVCENEKVYYAVYDSLTNPNGDLFDVYLGKNVYFQTWNHTDLACSAYPVHNNTSIYTCFTPTSSGWYNVTVDFAMGDINTCGVDTTHYFASKLIYIEVNPLPSSLNIFLDGTSPFCPGDTASVWVNDTVANASLSGPGIIYTYPSGDTVLAIHEGYYSYSYTVVDSTTGCFKTFNPLYELIVKPTPQIFSNTTDNIICPYDSILLTAPNAVSYEWVGPQGILIGNTQSIYVHVTGFYHCVITDFDLCEMTSNTIELLEYSSPYLIANPDKELCHSGAIDLYVDHSGSPFFNWINPSGLTSEQITVSQPGTYICQVSQCGFIVTDSIVITQSNIIASILALTDTVMCSGDSAILLAQPNGMIFYEWSDNLGYNNTLFVTQEGKYAVTVMDINGCTATSDSISISFHQGSKTPVPFDVSVCIGDSVILTASYNSQLNWYDENFQLIYVGDTIVLNNLLYDSLFYITNSDSYCESDFVEIHASIYSSSLFLDLPFNDTSICSGQDFLYDNQSTSSLTNIWTLPDSSIHNGSELILNNADTLMQGYYYLQVSDQNCISPIDSFYLFVNPLPTLSLSLNDSTICPFDTVFVSVSASDSIFFDNYSSGYQNINYAINYYSDGVIYTTNSFGCSVFDTINISHYPVSYPSAMNDYHLCGPDSVIIEFNDSSYWYIENTTLQGYDFETNPIHFTQNTIVYYSEIDSLGCRTSFDSLSIIITPLAAPLIFNIDSVFCQGQIIYYSTDADVNSDIFWFNNDSIIGIGQIIDIVASNSDTIFLYFQDGNCISDTSQHVFTVIDSLQTPIIITDTLICLGQDYILTSLNFYDSLSYWETPIGQFYSDSIFIENFGWFDVGDYAVISDNQGCISTTNIFVGLHNVPPSPFGQIPSQITFCQYDSINIYFDVDTTMIYEYTYQNLTIVIDNSLSFNVIDMHHAGSLLVNTTDTNGCSVNDTLKIIVSEYPLININDTTICEGTSFEYVLNPNYENYFWQDGISNSTYQVSDSGLYIVEVLNGACYVSDSAWVSTVNCTPLNANVFSPNGDGINDNFRFVSGELLECEIIVYNRWGRIVFESNESDFAWNGTHYMTGLVLSEGTYYYVVKGVKLNNTTYEATGFVTLVR